MNKGISGIADLPLHDGYVPSWLVSIMKRLAKAIVEVIVMEFSTEGLLRRLSNPYWFQAFNNAIGMDWDSSGSTTVTTAILKEVLRGSELGIRVAGGKGRLARKTPIEIEFYGEELGLNSSVINYLKKSSVLAAKTDSALLQDGFTLYHHVLIFDSRGRWVVIQQGMNVKEGIARRYHIAWYSTNRFGETTLEPHSGIASDTKVRPLDLSSKDSLDCRKVIIDLVNEGPNKVKNLVRIVNAIIKGIKPLIGELPRGIDRSIPYYRPVNLSNKALRILKNAYEIKPRNIDELLLSTNVGPETLRSLALIAELIYREPPSLNDPVTTPYDPFKYAFIIGGKDGIPFPIKKELALNVIKELVSIIEEAKLGRKEKLLVLRSLSRLAPKDVLLRTTI